ncbi:AAA family ATPase [Streptomyces anulatus]|uniref:AAA family ATPase n=1 Tax=Streptomyces anulatus TaxID=1892 RepID=UPI002252368C|nr:AAA family ATPase [Streptomyces anulatus]MCX4523711.1 AAA family ATPase [Streptomyces anulatus]MCX4523840.1 AAA family ATPase [Streptomyces anulatus]MCX4606650.1 AAA family ATPase [Streptomyces anulatus]
MTALTLPAGALCALIGPPGAGKSTFARQHFKPTEIVSSDFCRALVADDENDQSATGDAFEVLHLIVDKRLARGRLTVIDATNLRDDRPWLLARACHWKRPTTAVLFDVPLATVQAQNAGRDRVVPAHVVREFHGLLPTVDQLHDEGWDAVHLFSTLTRRSRTGR